MQHALFQLGSLWMAVTLIIAIAAALAYGTIYEARFGTDAVKYAVYASLWFRALLCFLAINLAAAAIQRYPWQRKHIPFVAAHAGIILILIGGVIGGALGVEGQMVIAEGQAEQTIRLHQNALILRDFTADRMRLEPTHFEARAWDHQPDFEFVLAADSAPPITLRVEKYYPDAVAEERVLEDGLEPNPAIAVHLQHAEDEQRVWLLARDPQRAALSWGELDFFFIEAPTAGQWQHLFQPPASGRGSVILRLPNRPAPVIIPVPEIFAAQPLAIEDTGYQIEFRDYFPDLAIDEQGVHSRSDQPNNPAVSFTLSGAEGVDAYLLFALHPDFGMLHGQQYHIPAVLHYEHPATQRLPAEALLVALDPQGTLQRLVTDAAGRVVAAQAVALNERFAHPGRPAYAVRVEAFYPRARREQSYHNRSNTVKQAALQVSVSDGQATERTWVGAEEAVAVRLGERLLRVEYGPMVAEVPARIKLLDFRKEEYPGTQVAASFESDVEVHDLVGERSFMQTISMNQPLVHRGYKFFQASYVEGVPETTVLAVRKDPGVPLVYTGYLIVLVGVVWMFLSRSAMSKP